MVITRSLLLILAAACFLAILSCGGGGGGGGSASGVVTCADSTSYTPPAEVVADDSNDHMEIINDDTELDQYFSCTDTEVFDSSNPLQSGVVAAGVISLGQWGSGFSLRLWAQTSPPKIVGKAAAKPGGVTLNDLSSGGRYTGIQESPPYIYYRVEIDGAGSPDTFKWSDDNGTTWQVSSIAITAGSAQTLSNSVTVTFGADTGHTVGDYWNLSAGILQATSVEIRGRNVIVSYSMVGSSYLGAIRVYRTYFGFPFLRSQALFRDTDINAVSVSGSNVYAVGTHEPVVTPSILEVIGLTWARLILTGNQSLELPSFAGTSVIHDSNNGKIYATSGNTGGLAIVDDSTFTIDSQISIDDARWVHFEDNTSTLVVAEGCCGSSANGQISVYDINAGAPSYQNSFGFTGADIASSKSTVEVIGGKAIIAAGSGGVHVMSTVTGTVLASIAIPTAAESGIPDPNLRVANAVSIDEDLMFISFGEAGIYVAQADDDFDNTGSEGPVTLTRLGKLQFGSLQSVNHVAFRGNYLYIASGLGGLKIVRIYSR